MSSSSKNSRLAFDLPNRAPNLPFSDAILAGDTLYLSGRIGIDPSTGLAPPEVEKELEFLFSGFTAVLAKAGMGWDDLVWVQVFSPDLTLWERFNMEYVKHFHGEFPARAFVGSAPLLRNGRFEMMGIAVKKSHAVEG
jgi:enamine deaminase RidA (YjgF/YER057c/UK114 family)